MKRLFALAAIAALSGCSSGSYSAPPEPDEAPPLAAGEIEPLAKWIITLGDNTPEAREAAAEEIRKYGLAAGPMLFEGAVSEDAERAAASRELLDEFRRHDWETAPPVDDAFAATLREALKPGHPARVWAWWWTALGSRIEDSRRIVADPSPYFADPNADVRRYAAILYVRLGHEVRKLAEILDSALEDALRAPGAFKEWEPVLASLAAAGFNEGELLEVREKLRRFVDRLEAFGEPLPWWDIRAFFRRAGPGTEPLLASILLYERPGTLRRLAAISYGLGRQVRSELQRAYGAKPDDDLAIALGNAGLPSGAKNLQELLKNTTAGSRDRWAAALALEYGTGLWFGDAANEADAAARWASWIPGSEKRWEISFRCNEGGVFLDHMESGWRWQLGIGPISRNMISREEPAWAVFEAECWGRSCADVDLALAWRLNRDTWLLFANGIAGGTDTCDERAERLLRRAITAAHGGDPLQDPDTTKTPPIQPDAIKAAHATLLDPATSDAAKAAAIRRLTSGGDQGATAVAALLDTKPNPGLRRAAYLTLWQIDSEAALLALARFAGDTETKMDYQGIPDSAAPLLLRIRFRSLGVERLDAAGTDPAKWEALVREALKK